MQGPDTINVIAIHSCCCCSSVSKAELQTVIDEVEQQEAGGSIEPLPEDDTPTSILEAEPQAGQIESRKEYPVLGATELTLSNGMRVGNVSHGSLLVRHHAIISTAMSSSFTSLISTSAPAIHAAS